MTDLSTILFSNTTASLCGTIRWMSPELLEPTRFGSDGRPSRESDCYALGITIYEVSSYISRSGAHPLTHSQVLGGILPFHHLWPPIVVCAILKGGRPGMPLDGSSFGFTDTLWGLLQSCWSESASARPTARRLLDYLRPASLAWVPPPKLCHTVEGVVGTLSSDIFEVSGVPPSGSVCDQYEGLATLFACRSSSSLPN